MTPAFGINPGLFSVNLPAWSDLAGWDSNTSYTTIQCADIDGDGQAELMGLNSSGTYEMYHFGTVYGQWMRISDLPSGIGAEQVFFADIDGDGQAEMLAFIGPGFFGKLVNQILPYHYDPATGAWTAMFTYLTGILQLPSTFSGPSGIRFGVLHGQVCVFVQATDGVWIYSYSSATKTWVNPASANVPAICNANGFGPVQYSSTMQCADVNADGNVEILIRGISGVYMFQFEADSGTWSPPFQNEANGPQLSDAAGWNQAQYYSTMQCADIDGDKADELVILGPQGIYVFDYAQGAWSPSTAVAPNGPSLSRSSWSQAAYYSTIQCADVDADGRAEIVARGVAGIYVFDLDPSGVWTPSDDSGGPNGPALSDKLGWNQPQYYGTLRCADVNNDGKAELLGRQIDGMHTFQNGADSWTIASAPFPAIPSNAYQAIGTTLQIANGDLRSQYTNLIQDLSGYQTALGQSDFLSANNLDPTWQPYVNQLLSEVGAAIRAGALFSSFHQFIVDITLSNNISLQTVADNMALSQQIQSGSTPITGSVFNFLGNVFWALSGLATETPGVGVVVGLLSSAIGLATSIPGGQKIPVHPLTEPLLDLNTSLLNAFNNALDANNTNEGAVLLDYGLLMTVDGYIQSGFWAWPADPTPDPETVVENLFTIWAWQTLAPVAWIVCNVLYNNNIGGFTAPTDYQGNWFWWSETTTPSPGDTQQYCRWLAVPTAQLPSPINPTVLATLFNTMGVSPKDVLTGAGGWNIPLVPF